MAETDSKMIFSLDEFDILMSGGKKYAYEIDPAYSERNVAISIVSSDEYCPFAAVVIEGIIENASAENNYDIVVLTNDMLQRNVWRIEKMAESHDNISIRVLDISKMIEGFSFYTWAHFTSNTYYRLLMPDVFSKYDKVIYLDSDIVVNHDIAELYSTDVTEYYLACAYDTHVVSYCTRKPPLEQREYNMKTLKLEKPEEYFQAGVSIFNVKKIRNDFGEGYLIQKGLSTTLRWLDQDLVNMLFQGHIKRLPNKWNVMVSNTPDNIDEYHLPEDLRKEYFEARQNPYCIHYVGRAIPCYTTTPDLFEYFWKYSRNTAFYEILLQRMTTDYSEKLKQSVIYAARTGGLKLYPNRKTRLYMDLAPHFPEGSRRRAILDKLFR